jgi:hypothetical protein
MEGRCSVILLLILTKGRFALFKQRSCITSFFEIITGKMKSEDHGKKKSTDGATITSLIYQR